MLRFLLLWLGGVAGHLAACHAQPATPAADVLLLTTGQELSGRVLTITPTELTYLPAVAGTVARPDTAHLPTASVFLVRYANGTHEVIGALTAAPPPADASPPALQGLDPAQRQALGQRDALHYYRADTPYWAALGSTLYLGPLLGLAPAAAISSKAVTPDHLQAPQPLLLTDPAYAHGYQQQANRIKKRRTWSGYGVATAAYALLIGVLVGAIK